MNAVVPRVYLVDDDPGMRRSTGMLLDAAQLPFATYESANDFLADFSDAPGCLILDLSMPGMSGLDLVRHLRGTGARLPVLMVSGTGTIATAVEGMKLGIVDFLEKPVDPETLLAKVRAALDADAAQRAAACAKKDLSLRFAELTEREIEVVKCLTRGLSNKQVAAELDIAVKTVDNHRTRAMRKLNALNAADLTRMAICAGLV